jgi:hypothetical protein
MAWVEKDHNNHHVPTPCHLHCCAHREEELSDLGEQTERDMSLGPQEQPQSLSLPRSGALTDQDKAVLLHARQQNLMEELEGSTTRPMLFTVGVRGRHELFNHCELEGAP